MHIKFKFFFNFYILFLVNIFCLNSYGEFKDLETTETIKFISSKKEACSTLNHKLLINTDLIYYFKDCSLHLITEPHLVNTLIQVYGKKPIKISPEVYSSLPLGENYTFENYFEEYHPKFITSLCKKYNNKIVSIDNYNYFYIEKCKKRKFDSYADVQKFNTENDPIYCISKFEESRFPDSTPITLSKNTNDIREISEINLKNNIPNQNILCKKINNKVTAFHEGFFYVDKCKLHPISNLTIELQKKAQSHGGIQDLSIEQILGLEEDKEISSADVMKKLK